MQNLPVVVEAAINGGRSRGEHQALPYTPVEIAAEAHAAARAGAQIVHFHARGPAGEWTADIDRYRECVRRVRDAAPDVLVSITSIRPEGVPVGAVTELITGLAANAATRPDLVSVNLGHIAVWEPIPGGHPHCRQTIHYPNDYAAVVETLAVLRASGVVPELGVMDLGFVSHAVALAHEGRLPSRPWFLLELDSPGWGAGPQVAPSTVANFDHLAGCLGHQFRGVRLAAHGQGLAGYAVIERALATGCHIRVGFEDAVELPEGRPVAGNATLVTWAVEAADRHRRRLASLAETSAIVGLTAGL